mmetsp:Transcript_6760/g.11284  ORF Transcript_6760/g.11284 Transcript_6760/m.11284 type:complete len:357 (-) Transcript_6760:1439-2509(-)
MFAAVALHPEHEVRFIALNQLIPLLPHFLLRLVTGMIRVLVTELERGDEQGAVDGGHRPDVHLVPDAALHAAVVGQALAAQVIVLALHEVCVLGSRTELDLLDRFRNTSHTFFVAVENILRQFLLLWVHRHVILIPQISVGVLCCANRLLGVGRQDLRGGSLGCLLLRFDQGLLPLSLQLALLRLLHRLQTQAAQLFETHQSLADVNLQCALAPTIHHELVELLQSPLVILALRHELLEVALLLVQRGLERLEVLAVGADHRVARLHRRAHDGDGGRVHARAHLVNQLLHAVRLGLQRHVDRLALVQINVSILYEILNNGVFRAERVAQVAVLITENQVLFHIRTGFHSNHRQLLT